MVFHLNGHGSEVSLPLGEQYALELFWLVQQLKGCRSVLEIGSRRGNTLRFMAYACGYGALVRSIDIQGINLPRTINELCGEGFDAISACADSRSEQAIKWASEWAPYDFIFIDGDHSQTAVKADWENYRRMGYRVGFHDIYTEGEGVPAFWRELKESGYSTSEINLVPGFMGIGIVEDPQRKVACI